MRHSRLPLVLVLALAATLLCAGLAATLTGEDDERLLTFVVFAVATGPVLVGGAWALVPDPAAPDGPEHVEESVEHSWLERASAGAFTDLLTAMGLALAARYVLGAPDVPLVVFVVLGMGDVAVRYLVLSRREA